MSEKKKKILYLSLFVFILVLFLAAVDSYYYRDRVYPGVYITEINAGSRKVSEIEQLLAGSIEKDSYQEVSLTFVLNKKSWTYLASELGISADISASAEKAYMIGRKNFYLFRYADRIRLIFNPVTIALVYNYQEDKIKDTLAELSDEISMPAKDAYYVLSGDRKEVKIKPEKEGRELNTKETFQNLSDSLSVYPAKEKVEVAVKSTQPNSTASCLEAFKVTGEVTSFDTAVSHRIPNRTHNISLAAEAIDGYLITPGEKFSFNEVVGQATADQGYKNAPIIVGEEFVDGIGGGICQVSSTLYNVFLLAGLEITERTNHGMTVGYLSPGLDATIAYGHLDLKAVNNTDHGLWLKTFIEGNKLTISLYGDPASVREVQIYTKKIDVIRQKVVYEKTDSLLPGDKKQVQAGRPGYVVEVWRVFYEDGVENEKEFISRDRYRPLPSIYKVGALPEESDAE